MTIKKHLIVSGIVFTVVLFIWPIFMAIAQPSGPDVQHLEWIQNNVILFKLQFFFASLICPAIIYLMVSQLEVIVPSRISKGIGFIFLCGYAVLISISYASQVVVVPKLIEANLVAIARVLYFGSSVSVTYFINQLGYLFWSVGALFLFAGALREKGVVRYIIALYVLSAALQIVAFTGLLISSDTLNSLTLYSGLALLPVGILTVRLGFTKLKPR